MLKILLDTLKGKTSKKNSPLRIRGEGSSYAQILRPFLDALASLESIFFTKKCKI